MKTKLQFFILLFIMSIGINNIYAQVNCGEIFTDNGGANGNYLPNSNTTVTISPTTPGEVVSVTFTSFQVEATWDRLYIFDGNSVNAPQISSGNNGGNGATCNTLAGGFWGNQLQGLTITSSSPDGCLTFRFCSNASTNQAGWVANVNCIPPPPCAKPTNLVVTAIVQNTATVFWNEAGVPPATQWEVIIQPITDPAPSDSTPVNPTNITTLNPFPVTGLLPFTQYRVYVRAICANGLGNSLFAGPINFQTLIAPPVCGGNFVDTGGPTGLYGANSDSVTTICPVNTGEVVTVNFTAFQTQLNTDALYIFNGNSIDAPLLSSANPAGAVPGGVAGGYWDTQLLNHTIVSSSPDGCLTFRFRSNATTQQAGWLANIICIPAPPCDRPTNVTVPVATITHNTATVSWTENGIPPATSWEIIVLPAGSPAPTNIEAVVPENVYTTNPAVVSGLTGSTQYIVFVRAICSNGNGTSFWSGPIQFTTNLTPPDCGEIFTDSGGVTGNYTANENSVTTICPVNTGEVVTVNFTAFQTETNFDRLYIYDGNTVNTPQISSGNLGGSGASCNTVIGGFWGNQLVNQTIIASSPSGCLTFRFCSDGSGQQAGWVANVICVPSVPCSKPTNLLVSNITSSSAELSWSENGVPPATQWEVITIPLGTNAPTYTQAVNPANIVTSNPFTVTGLNSGSQYSYFVRAICANGLGNSLWTGPKNFNTIITNDECINATNVPVNSGSNCTLITPGTLTGATASSQVHTCEGTPNDDVWYSFIATSTSHLIDLNTTSDLVHAVYSGNCGSLTQISCNNPNISTINNLIIGATYYIRVYSWTATPNQTFNFNVCVGILQPPITTSTSLYTVPELVENVLLNSSCAMVSNVTWKTGNTNGFESTNGIGYFNKNNSSFPFQEGIILSTGDALTASGPNTTSQGFGNQAWTGDYNLDSIILAETGQVMNSRNASVLEFDFIPTYNFMNFDFIFAAEEYGTFQCAFSDAFAFLLTNTSTGVTTNLALVPGTASPISVVTIRDQLYNTSCSSVNSNLFGEFYGTGGSNIYNSPHNFNGDTLPLSAYSTVTPGVVYHIKLVIADRLDNAFDSAVFIKGGSMAFGNQCSENLQLIPFVDSNSNGIKDNGELLFTSGNFAYEVNNDGNVVYNSSNTGNTFIYPSNITNIYDIQYQIDPTYAPYYSTNTVFNDVSILANSGTNLFYFPIVITNTYNDVAVSVIANGPPPRPGFTYKNKILYTNYGLTPASGTLSFSKASVVTINSIVPSGFTSTLTGFDFNYTNLSPFETRQMIVNMQVPNIPTVALGDLLTNSASITSLNTDIDLTNNQSNLTQEIVGSYDPNNIIESRGEKILFSSFNTNDYLFYTINFQNLGTASALRVVVDNLLNNNLLDVNTFEMISSSHNYIVERKGNLLKWTFQDINLASHLTNIEESQGYITYKIKPKPGFTIGTIIPNSADIYFDFNPAIVTETFNTEFVNTLSNSNFNKNIVAIFPNPANDSVTIKSFETIKNIVIIDMQGKLVYQKEVKDTNTQTIVFEQLARGIYTISITTDENTIHQKLILK